MASQIISTFIKAAAACLENRSSKNETIDNILDALVLSDVGDIIDENSNWLSSLLQSLYWLLQSFNEYTVTAKKCVEVLIKLCSRDIIRTRLTKNVFFIPLCNFLTEDVSKEEKYKLLKLVDQLSVDIKITFLPENIYATLDILSAWVINQNDLISAISLQILSNMCYKNDNIKFTLSNSKHFKDLYRHCINEMNNSIHANKMLLIFNFNDHKLPTAILKLLTYEVIFELIQTGDARVLREKVDIFFELRNAKEDGFLSLNSQDYDFRNKFIKYLEDAPRDTVTGAQLAAETFRFLRMLIAHSIPALSAQNIPNRLAKVALSWCSIDNAELVYNMDCAQVESILLLLALVDSSNISKKIDHKSVFDAIEKNWVVLQDLVMSVLKSTTSDGNKALHLALVRLMRSVIGKDSLRELVVILYENFDVGLLFNLSSSLPNLSNPSKSIICLKDDFFDLDACKSVDQRLIILYTVGLFIDILQYENKCSLIVKKMLSHTQVQTVFAHILMSKDDREGPDVKLIVLSIMQSGYLPLTDFSKVFHATHVFDWKLEPIKQIHYPKINETMSTSKSHRERFEELLAKLEDKIHSGELDMDEIISLCWLQIAQADRRTILAQETVSAQSKTLANFEQESQICNVEINRLSRKVVEIRKALNLMKKENADINEKSIKQQNIICGIQDQQIMLKTKFNDELRKVEGLREQIKEKDVEMLSLKRKHEEEVKKYHYKMKKQEKEAAKLLKDVEDLNEEYVKLKQLKEDVEKSLQQTQEEVNKKNLALLQRQNDLILIQKEKESLAAKIASFQDTIQNMHKMFN